MALAVSLLVHAARASAQLREQYVPPEESVTGETGAEPETGAGMQGEEAPAQAPGAGPHGGTQSGNKPAQPKPKPDPKASAAKFSPDRLFPEKKEHIPTRCGGTPPKNMKKALNGQDAIDLDFVTVVKGTPIADWPITSKLSSVSFGRGEICTPHSKSGRWPQLPFFGDAATKVEGNMWIFAYINGRWVGGAGHWLRPGQTCKITNLNEVGPDLYYDAPPLRNWSPCRGELVGFAVSTPARAGQWGTAERSNVFLIRWP